MRLTPENIPNGMKSAEALRGVVAELRAELRQKQGTIDDMLDRNVHVRAQLEHVKTVVIPKKKKGKVDELGWRYVKKQIQYQMIANLMTMPAMLVAAAQTGEYTHFLLAQGLLNAVIPPLQVYFTKRAEVH